MEDPTNNLPVKNWQSLYLDTTDILPVDRDRSTLIFRSEELVVMYVHPRNKETSFFSARNGGH